jgi:hypothetical protein
MRRSEDQFHFSGFVMKHLAKAHDNATIWRLDKDRLWRLDLADKTYTECPLSGCPAPREAPQRPRQQAPQPQERPTRKPSCQLTVAKNRFSVKSTGQTRTINGFSTQQYQVSWELVLQDPDKKKDSSRLAIELWTTAESDPRITAVRSVENGFERALRAKRPERSGLGKVVPAEAMKVVALQLLNGLSQDQRAAVASASEELAKVHGHPISTQLDWFMDAQACPGGPQPQERKEASSGLEASHGVGGLLGSAAGLGAQKGAQSQAREMAGKPVFSFVEEVQEMDVQPASDGLFIPPAGFKLASRP